MHNIVLVGYMGSGKTTVGKDLARKCEYTFIDTDEEIEKIQGKTIKEIFASEGESSFRNMETEYLKDYLHKKVSNQVLSTGGGMVIRPQNQELIKKLGTVIYLQATPDTIYQRVKKDTSRPLLQCENPMLKIQNMIKDREASYLAAADYVVQVDDKKQSEIADYIIQILASGGKV